MIGKQIYTWDEMSAVHCLLGAIREAELALVTADSLVGELRTWGAAIYVGDKSGRKGPLDSALSKLSQESGQLLAAWVAREDWVCVRKDEFSLLTKEVA